MNLSTQYLGLTLRSPLIAGASPLADTVDSAHRLQDAGCGAIVMRSLFEEQIYLDRLGANQSGGSVAETSEYQLSPEQYLEQLRRLKAALQIPIIASLNGCRPGGWIDYARRFEEAGADAIELNCYQFVSDSSRSAQEIESELIETVALIRATVTVPVAVKLCPYYTSLAHVIAELEDAGAGGFVLFNRVYQPDFDAADCEPHFQVKLSESSELLPRLRWTALLHHGVRGSLALNGGVQRAEDVVKALLVGADAVQVVSVILKYGPRFLSTLNEGLREWMRRQGHATLSAFRGSMAPPAHLAPGDEERAHYRRMLQLWRV